MQQEQLDEQMLKTGTVPVADAVHQLPTAANGESKSSLAPSSVHVQFVGGMLTGDAVKGKQQAIEEDDEEAELRKLQAEMAM